MCFTFTGKQTRKLHWIGDFPILQNSIEPITGSMDDFILCLLLWLPPTICSNQVNETSERKRAEITALMTGGMQCARASPVTSARQNVQKWQKYIKSVKISIQYYLTVTIFSSYHLTNDETCLNVVANIQSKFNFSSFLHRLSYTYARHDIMKWKKNTLVLPICVVLTFASSWWIDQPEN